MRGKGHLNIYIGLIFALIILFLTSGTTLGQAEDLDLSNQILKAPPITLSQVYHRVDWVVDYPNLSIPLRVNRLAPEDCVGDVNGDGLLDIIFVESSDQLICIDGNSGELLWRSDVAVNHYRTILACVPSIYDLEGDGDLEVVVGAAYGRLAILDASTGGLERSILLGNVATKPHAIDLDGDGYLDIIVGIYSPAPNPTIVCVSGRTLLPIWTYEGPTPVEERPAISDVDGDGIVEVIVAEMGDRIVCLTGVNGTVEWISDGLPGIDSFPIIADLDADDNLEIIVAGNLIYILKADDGELIRSVDVPHIGYLLVGNLDADTHLEILTVQFDLPRYIIIIIDGDSYEKIQDVPASFNNWYLSDLDGDHIDEVIVSDGYGRIFAYYPYLGDVEILWKNVTLETIFDVDGDGHSEILVSDSESLSLIGSNDPEIDLIVHGLAEGETAYPEHVLNLEFDVIFHSRAYLIQRIEVQMGHGSRLLKLAILGNGTEPNLEDDLSDTVSIMNSTHGPPQIHNGVQYRIELVFGWDCPLTKWIDASMIVVYNDDLVRTMTIESLFRIEYGIHFTGEATITVSEGKGLVDGMWLSNGSTIRLQGIRVVHDSPSELLVESHVFGIDVLDENGVILSIGRGSTLPELDLSIIIVHKNPGEPAHDLTVRLSGTVPGCVPGNDFEVGLFVDAMPPILSNPDPPDDYWVNSAWTRVTIKAEDPIGPNLDSGRVECRVTPGDDPMVADWMESVEIERIGNVARYEMVIHLPEDGPYTIQWRAIDLLGNHGSLFSLLIIRDTKPPILEPIRFKYWDNTLERTFMVNVIDEGSGVDHQRARYVISDDPVGTGEWMDAEWDDVSTVVIQGRVTTSGRYTLVLEVKDDVGTMASVIVPFGVDLLPPSMIPDVPWIINVSGGLVDIGVEIDDHGASGIGPSGLEFALDEHGTNWTQVPMTSILTEGVVQIRFKLKVDSLLWLRGTDMAGNPTGLKGPYELNLNEPPMVEISKPRTDGSYVNPVEIDGRASTDPEGLDLMYTWILDGSRLETGKSFNEITIDSGAHSLILEVDDGYHTNRSSAIEFEVSDVVSPFSSPIMILLIIIIIIVIITSMLLYHERERDH